jgi:hypothetical protein
MALGVAEMRHFKRNRSSERAECRAMSVTSARRAHAAAFPGKNLTVKPMGDVPKGLRHRSQFLGVRYNAKADCQCQSISNVTVEQTLTGSGWAVWDCHSRTYIHPRMA